MVHITSARFKLKAMSHLWSRPTIRYPLAGLAGLILAISTACSHDAATNPPAPTTPERTPQLTANAVVDRVVDGDTLIARIDGHDVRVRLIGVDTPETVDPRRPVQCFGAEASRFLSQLLPSTTPITLVRDEETTDRYGRLLAYVYRSSDALFINLALLETGHGATSFYEPNTAFITEFTTAEATARAQAAGLWGACGGPDVPRD